LRAALLGQGQSLLSAAFPTIKAYRLDLVDAHVRPAMVRFNARQLEALLELRQFLGVSVAFARNGCGRDVWTRVEAHAHASGRVRDA
jgi:hypothetical protein